jgi:hypothetical protein
MKAHELPERWRLRVADHALSLSNGKHSALGASAFGNQHIRLTFPDGSSVFFMDAFALTDEEAGEIAVFTEHCGYHVFPLADTAIDISKGNVTPASFSTHP